MANATRRCALSILLSRGLRAPPVPLSPQPHLHAVALAALHGNVLPPQSPAFVPSRPKTKTSRSSGGYSPLNDPSPNRSNRPPKETILLDGCDYEHWLIVMEFPEDNKPSEDQMIDTYVKTLAAVVGSEEEARKKIYSVCTSTYTGFGALISEELSFQLKKLPGVLWVLPDSYLDVEYKDYGGDLFIDGKVVHRPQFRYNETQRIRKWPRARYGRHCETMQVDRRELLQRSGMSQGPRGSAPQQTNGNSHPAGTDGSANEGS